MDTKKKTVAIIGGGPSGLTTAKSMFEAGLIPTIFEAKNNIGGLWSPPQEGNVETIQLDTRMSTNSSHYSCMFSDWFPYTREELPIYPATPAIWKYLCGFAEKYLPKETVRLGCRVVSVSSDDPEGLASWTVGFEDSEGQTRSEVFEYLVVCTGNFSNGFIPHIDELRKFPGTAIHSSEYVGANIIPQDEPAGAKRKILVVGGTLSAVEIASDVALFASSLPKEHRSQIQVLHLFSQPFWILPKLLPFENPDDKTAPKVLPLDQVFFNAAAVVNAPPPTSPEAKFEQINKLLASMLGDQSNIGPEYKFNDHWNMNPMAVGMTESYDKFVRSGVIKPVVGRYTGISEEGAVRVAAAEHCELSSDQVLDGVDTIIFATGFTPWPALKKMLAPEILRRMGFEPEETDVSPHRVHRCLYKQNIHPNLGKHIGFMGLMPRPFWGAMEIQGRWLASMFSGKMPWPTPDEISDFAKGPEWLAAQGRVDDAVLLRGEGAYLDVISDLSKKMKLAPFEIAIAGDHAPKTFVPAHLPAFSPSNNGALEHSQNAISILHRVLAEDAVSPENISRAVFAELQGRWAITRTLSSKLPGFPDGDFIGTAEFHPRLPTFSSTAAAPTAAGPSCQNRTIAPPTPGQLSLGRQASEYLYSEEGELTTTSGFKLQGKRKYIYQLGGDYRTTAWFVKPDGESADYFFHEIDFTRAPEVLGTPGVDGVGGWKAASEHLCVKDWYWPAYRFVFKGSRLERFWIRYKVMGPHKDYISEAQYVRA